MVPANWLWRKLLTPVLFHLWKPFMLTREVTSHLPRVVRHELKFTLLVTMASLIVIVTDWNNDAKETAIGAIISIVFTMDFTGSLSFKKSIFQGGVILFTLLTSVVYKVYFVTPSHAFRRKTFVTLIFIVCLFSQGLNWAMDFYYPDCRDCVFIFVTGFLVTYYGLYFSETAYESVHRSMRVCVIIYAACVIVHLLLPSQYSYRDMYWYIRKKYRVIQEEIRGMREKLLPENEGAGEFDEKRILKDALKRIRGSYIPKGHQMVNARNFSDLRTSLYDMENWFTALFLLLTTKIEGDLAVNGLNAEVKAAVGTVLDCMAKMVDLMDGAMAHFEEYSAVNTFGHPQQLGGAVNVLRMAGPDQFTQTLAFVLLRTITSLEGCFEAQRRGFLDIINRRPFPNVC